MAETPLCGSVLFTTARPRHLRGNAQALRRIGAGGRRLQDDKASAARRKNFTKDMER